MDKFNQTGEAAKVDILWVVDNSGSMREEQDALAYNFDVFIRSFSEKAVDFQMGIITTDTRSNYWQKNLNESLKALNDEKMAEDKDKFMDDFKRLIQVGTHGWGYEKGLKASTMFTNSISNNGKAAEYFRDDAYLIVVYISDEEDQSEGKVANYLKDLQKWKDHDGLVKAYSIVDVAGKTPNGYGYTKGYERYAEITNQSGGKIADITGDFHNTLSEFGEDIVGLTDKYPLGARPYDENAIKVFVDGVEWSSGWNYNQSNNTIEFSVIPPLGSVIEVKYQVEQEA